MWHDKCSAKCGCVLWNVVQCAVMEKSCGGAMWLCAVMWNTLRCDVEWCKLQNYVIQMCSKMCTVECCNLNLV